MADSQMYVVKRNGKKQDAAKFGGWEIERFAAVQFLKFKKFCSQEIFDFSFQVDSLARKPPDYKMMTDQNSIPWLKLHYTRLNRFLSIIYHAAR